MKKLIIIVTTLFIAASGLFAAEVTGEKYLTKDFDFKDFSGIVASGFYDFEVVLTESSKWSVSITYPEILEEYIVARVSNGKLYLSMTQVPVKVTKKLKGCHINAKVSMPVLKSLSLSGACKFQCADSYDIGSDDFKLDVSGAAEVGNLDVKARSLNMELSGASKVTLKGEFQQADIEMGGAAKCNFSINSDILNCEVSGTAKAYHTGEFEEVNAEVSGAGVFSFSGAAENVDLELSGAAKAEMGKAMVNEMKASLSGVSFGEVNASKVLQIETSGGASLRYIDNPGLKLDIRSVGRYSSIEKKR